jgi:diguanylate cyclase (GGDEF)-like protein
MLRSSVGSSRDADLEGLPAAARAELEGHLRLLGETLKQRTEHVVDGIRRRTEQADTELEPTVDESFVRVGTVSTIAVAQWMAGEGVEVAREVGQESWSIFGQLAAQRAAPLNEVTKRCLRWRDAAADVVGKIVAELELPESVLVRAHAMLQRSLDVTLVRMCQSFEAERQRSREELARRQEELAFMATHDALTGLPNRTLILDRVEQMLVRARRNQTPVAVLFIDLDNFKGINDTLGHGAGDELLRAVAWRLRDVVRDVDVLGRLGGDEFVVVAEGISSAVDSEPIAERLLEALKQPFELRFGSAERVRLAVTASVGVAIGERATAEELLRDADIAMYRAKWDGKNGYVVFEPGMEDAVQSSILRGAYDNEELLVCQPTFEVTDTPVLGTRPRVVRRLPRTIA